MRADDERPQDADRHVTLRILGLLRGGGHRVESDVGEEHHPRAAQHARRAELSPDARVGRNEGLPVVRVDVLQTVEHDQQNDADLEHHDQVVDPGRLPDADHQDGARREYDEHRGQVQECPRRVPARGYAPRHARLHVGGGTPLERRIGELRGNVPAEEIEQAHQVARPADTDGGGPAAYSRTRSQPMIQATSSPMVAYE